MSEHQLEITRNKVERMKAELEAAEIGDSFAERARRETERREAELQRQQQAEADRETQRLRARWLDEWISWAIQRRPFGIPRDAELDIDREVSAALEDLDPERAEHVARRRVEAAITKALAPWREAKDTADAIEAACDSVPYGFRRQGEFKDRARLAASGAIEKLRPGATRLEKDAGARGAVQQVQREFAHKETVRDVLRSGVSGLHGASGQEREDAKELIHAKLAAMPVGASRREMQCAADEALEPICAAIGARQKQARAEQARKEDQDAREGVLRSARTLVAFSVPQNAQATFREIEQSLAKLPAGTPKARLEQWRDTIIERHRNKHARAHAKPELIAFALGEIRPYLRQLHGDYEFDLDETPAALEPELKREIRAALEEELTGSEKHEDVSKRVRRLVREALDIQ